MKNLKILVEHHQAKTSPASKASIQDLEKNLGLYLSDEYKDYLSTFGVIAYGPHETYGLGVPNDYYLNINSIYGDLSQDPTYPKKAVPLLDIGDGQYYLYDNSSCKILIWSTPNGGVVNQMEIGLESFLIQYVFAN